MATLEFNPRPKVSTAYIAESLLPSVQYQHVVPSVDTFSFFTFLLLVASDPVYSALLATLDPDIKAKYRWLTHLAHIHNNATLNTLVMTDLFPATNTPANDVHDIITRGLLAMQQILRPQNDRFSLFAQALHGGKRCGLMTQTMCIKELKHHHSEYEHDYRSFNLQLSNMDTTYALEEAITARVCGVSLSGVHCPECNEYALVLSQLKHLPWSLTFTHTPSAVALTYKLNSTYTIGPTFDSNLIAQYRLVLIATSTHCDVRNSRTATISTWQRYMPDRHVSTLEGVNQYVTSTTVCLIVLERIDV